MNSRLFSIDKILAATITGLGLSVFTAVAHAESNFAVKTEGKPEAKAKAPAAAAVKPDAKQAELKKQIEEKKQELNGSRWDISLIPAGAKEGKADELTFQDGKVRFRSFGDKGFEASNYTISIPEGSETAVWETMQNSEKNGVLFVRGEWKEETMSGVISQQDPGEPERPAQDFRFSTEKKTAISPTSEEKKEEVKEAVGDEMEKALQA